MIVGVEVKQDGFLGSTAYNIGAHPHSLPNINIALIAFDATCKTKLRLRWEYEVDLAAGLLFSQR